MIPLERKTQLRGNLLKIPASAWSYAQATFYLILLKCPFGSTVSHLLTLLKLLLSVLSFPSKALFLLIRMNTHGSGACSNAWREEFECMEGRQGMTQAGRTMWEHARPRERTMKKLVCAEWEIGWDVEGDEVGDKLESSS